MASPPTGTVTFLFTDIEGSTSRWEQYPQQMSDALARHDRAIRAAIQAADGYVFKTVGDAVCAAFTTPLSALSAAISAQLALLSDEAHGGARLGLKVRMALHTGAVEVRDADYFGQPLNRLARLLTAGHGGQIILSLSTQDLIRDQLPPGVQLFDLGEHRLKDLIRPERVFQVFAQGLPTDFPPLRTLESHPNNLPTQPTRFIGREAELAKVEALIRREDVHLVALTGPGGTGKTRLGLQVAADLLHEFEDGAFAVELGALTQPSLVPTAIARSLGLTEAPGRSHLDAVLEYLSRRQMLLLLDNFEQVLEAAPTVAAILRAAPSVKVIVASRAELNLYGEHHFPVPPLETPDSRHLPPLDQLTQYEAVRLFIERAQAARPDFSVTNESAPAVAEICVRLDGLPLAIELAAARVKLFPAPALLARLGSTLSFLTGGASNLPARHQTLRAAIAWSYDLLSAGEQHLFRRVAVFQGGRTLEALEAVCNYDRRLQLDMLEGVESLISKSLLQQREGSGGEPRFWMLETIHEFAREKLQESGEAQALAREHALYFLKLAQGAEPHLAGATQLEWFGRLEDEYDNLRTALSWAVKQRDAETAQLLSASLWQFWETRGYWNEARQWLQAALGTGGAADTRARAQALSLAGFMAWLQHDNDPARAFLEESLAMSRRLGDKGTVARSARRLGLVLMDKAEWQAARAALQESLDVCREIGDRNALSAALSNLGALYLMKNAPGDDRRGLECGTEALELARQRGDERLIPRALHILGALSLRARDFQAASAYNSEGLEVARRLQDKFSTALMLENMGWAACLRGDCEEAERLLRESMSPLREMGSTLFLTFGLGLLALTAARTGRAERAVVLFSALKKQVRVLGRSDHDVRASLGDMEGAIGEARGEIDGASWARAWAEGQQMNMEEALDFALQDDPASAAATSYALPNH